MKERMSKIEKLIEELCPDGVENYKISDLCLINRGKVISKEYLNQNTGEYPVYSSQTEDLGVFGYINTYDYDGEYVTWTTDGANAGSVFYRNCRFNITNVCGLLKPKNENLNTKYLSYILGSVAKKYVNSGMGNPKLMSNNMSLITIPVPPLEVQEEIVRILDSFTQLEAELEAELEARRKQYDRYRNKLLIEDLCPDGVEWKVLGEEFPFIRNGFVGTVTPFYTDAENGVRYLQGTNIHRGVISDNVTYYITKEFHKKCKRTELKADDILMVQSGHVGESAVVGEKYEGCNCHALIVMSNRGKCNSNYVNYYFQSTEGKEALNRITTGGTVKHILASEMKKLKIPIPPIEVQEEIVRILDKFEALVNDISIGLPAELSARRKQYEHYRNKLLTFKEKNEA